MPYLQVEVEDGQGDRWQENGRPALAQVQRDGPMQLPTAAAFGLRYFQELRGLVACGFHGRKRSCHAWQGHFLRAQGGGRCWWQEEVRRIFRDTNRLASTIAPAPTDEVT